MYSFKLFFFIIAGSLIAINFLTVECKPSTDIGSAFDNIVVETSSLYVMPKNCTQGPCRKAKVITIDIAVSILPGGIVFGFYLFFRAFNIADDTKVLWPLITAPVCALVISFVITSKKRIQEKYTFDNLYYNSLACGFYIVSGLFFMRHSMDIASFFGSAGTGIAYISSLTYAGYTTGNTKQRHRAIAGFHHFYFLGITVSALLHAVVETVEDAEFKCGLTLIGLSILILGILISNQILNYCNLNNYRTSSDNLWNYYNVRNWLYKNRPDTMAIYQRMDNRYRQPAFVIVNSKESVTVFCILLANLVNFMMFCHVTMALGFTAFFTSYQMDGYLWLMIMSSVGMFSGICLQSILAPKTIYLIFGIVKCASLVCILIFLETYTLTKHYIIYYLAYFFCVGGLYPIPTTMLLEVANPRNCEFVLSSSYLLQIILLNVVTYFSKWNVEYFSSLNYFVRVICIAYLSLSALAMIIIQISSPLMGSLIEIRNYIIGIRKSKVVTFIE